MFAPPSRVAVKSRTAAPERYAPRPTMHAPDAEPPASVDAYSAAAAIFRRTSATP